MSPRLLMIGAAILVVVLGLIGVMEFNNIRQKNIASAKTWHVDGPPCPVTTVAALKAQFQDPNRVSEYEGVVFARRTGHVECKEVANNGGMGFGKVLTCQFTSPASLMARVDGVESAWFPGPGQPASLLVEKGQIRCVMAGDRTMSLK